MQQISNQTGLATQERRAKMRKMWKVFFMLTVFTFMLSLLSFADLGAAGTEFSGKLVEIGNFLTSYILPGMAGISFLLAIIFWATNPENAKQKIIAAATACIVSSSAIVILNWLLPDYAIS